MKTDLTQYGAGELDMWIQNDEYLYNGFMKAVQINDFDGLIDNLQDFFIFTEEQQEDLKETFNKEREEYEKD